MTAMNHPEWIFAHQEVRDGRISRKLNERRMYLSLSPSLTTDSLTLGNLSTRTQVRLCIISSQ